MKSSNRVDSSSNGGPALSNGDFFGESLTSLGDLNGDGIIEIAVAARGTDVGGPNRGAVYMMSLRMSSRAILPDGASGFWPGNGNSDDLIVGNDGDLVNGASFGPALVGDGFVLDGIDDFVEMPQFDGPVYAFETWFRSGTEISTSSYQPLVQFSNIGTTDQSIILGDGTLYVTGEILTVVNGNGRTSVIGTGFNAGEWNHLAVSWNAALGRYDFYVNGVVQNVTSGSAPHHAGLLTASDLRLGQASNAYFFNGTIDEPTTYNLPISTADIQTIVQLGAIGKRIDNAPPSAVSGGTYSVGEGGSISLNGSQSSDSEDDQSNLMFEWDFDYDGITFQTNATGVTPVFSASGLNGPLTRTIALRVTDSCGAARIDTTAVSINNVGPTAVAGGPYYVDAGYTVMLTSTGSSDPGLDIDIYEWDFNFDGVQFDVDASGGSAVFNGGNIPTSETRLIGLRIRDTEGAESISSAILHVLSPPVVIIDREIRSDSWQGGNGAFDRVQIVVSLSEATNNAVEAEFQNYATHLAGGNSSLPFFFSTLGLTVVGFESFDRVIEIGSFRAVYANRVTGTNSSEQLTGTEVSDLVLGNGGNDTIVGLGGNDIIIGSSGNDILNGGDGDDSYLYFGTSNGFDSFVAGGGIDRAIAAVAGTVIGVNGYASGVDEFIGTGDTIVRDTNNSKVLDFSSTLLTGIAEIDAAGGNDVVTASNLRAGVYRGGTGDDILNAGDAAVTWKFSGASNGFDSLSNGSGATLAIAETAGTVIGVNGYASGVDEFIGTGDTIVRDTNNSKVLDFSSTLLTGIAEIDAAGGNDVVTASNLRAGVYRGGTGDDILNAGDAAVTWKFSGASNGFDSLSNGSGATSAIAETAGTVIGVNGYPSGVDEFIGTGDTIVRDTNNSKVLDFSSTLLTGIAEIDAAGGNDVVTASNLSAGVYRGGTGDDILNAGDAAVTWKFSGASNGFDSLSNGSGATLAIAETAGTVIGVNGYASGVDEFIGTGDTIVRDTNNSKVLDFSSTLLTGIAEIDAAGGNDVVTASNLSAGVYRGGTGDDILNAGDAAVIWKFSGASNGFDSLSNGSGATLAIAETAGTVIGVNGYANGVDEFVGTGDTIIRDTNNSKVLDFSTTLLTGIAEIDAAGGNDIVTASNLSAGVYRGGTGDDILNAGNAAVIWKFSGASNGFDSLSNGSGATLAIAETAGTVIGVNGYASGVDEFIGTGDTIVRDTNNSKVLDFSSTLLTGIAEIDAAGGNDTVVVSLFSNANYRLGAGNDWLVFAAPAAGFEVAVIDFNLSGVDRVDLRSLTFGSGFADLQVTQENSATRVTALGLNLRLLDTLFSSINEDEFLFL